MEMPVNVLVLDMNNVIARNTMVFAAAQTPDGLPIGGIYGAIAMIRNYLAANPHDAVMAALDWGKPAFRTILCPEYKAQRQEQRSPEEERNWRNYREQCKYVHEVIGHLGMITTRARDWEGDDVIAALCLHRLRDHRCTIYSSDKDYTQLVDGDRVKFYDLTSSGYISPDPKYVLKRCLDPKTSDNLDGVPGVGPQKAEWLVDQADAAEPEQLIAWCTEHAGNNKIAPGKLKLINGVVAEQQKVRANWRCTNLALTAAECDAALKFRRRSPDRQAFTESCRIYSLQPLLADIRSVFLPYANLKCPV